MPTPPRKGESQDDFMSRCVTEYQDEGETTEQAQKICSAIWHDKRNSTSKRSVEDVYKRLAQQS